MSNRPLHTVLPFLRRIVSSECRDTSDAQLLERFLTLREDAAFEQLVVRHGRMVLGVCRRVLHDEHAAEDAFQAAFLALACRAASIRHQASVGGWLYRVAYRIALDARSHALRQAAREQPLDDAPASSDPQTDAMDRELRQVLDAEVNRLPEKYRVPFLRCCCEGETSAAVARDLGCPVGTVESWLTRARQRLRTGLARRGVELPAVLPVLPAVVPAPLLLATIKTATLVAAGQAAAAGLVPERVAALTEGVLRAMWMTRIRGAALLLLMVSTVGVGAVLLAQDQAALPEDARQETAVERAPADASKEKPVQTKVGILTTFNYRERLNLLDLVLPSKLPSMTVVIDPETGKWTKIADDAWAGRISPDGRSVLFGHNEKLWKCALQADSKAEPVAEQKGRPIWSPDGKQLVVSDGFLRNDSWVTKTRRLNVDGSGSTEIPVPDTDFVEDWSPDGKWLVTCSDRHEPHGSGYQLYRMHPDGTQQQRLTKDGLNCYARFSLDGKQIVFLHQAKGKNSLRVVDADGNNEREIWQEKDGTTVEGACWSPDSKRLAVVLFDVQKLPDGKTEDVHYRVEIMDADGKNGKGLKLVIPVNLTILRIGRPDWR